MEMDTAIMEGETVEEAKARVKKAHADNDRCKSCGGNAYGSAHSLYNPETKKFDRICNSCARKR